MKHTIFYNTLENIRCHITNEIKAAVKAHGGKYSWDEDEDWDAPIVAATPNNCYPEPQDACIHSIEIDPHGEIIIEATRNEYGDEINDLTLDDIFVEDLGFIIDHMEDTPDVFDVSIPFKQ